MSIQLELSTEEKVNIMQACIQGHTIQFKFKFRHDETDWIDHEGEPTWKWGEFDYRVKS